MSRQTRGMSYEPALDGLRAVAIVAVMIYHANERLLPGGYLGVDLFFVLSGYLITRLLSEELSINGKVSFFDFYIRRFLRLTPALWTLLVFCVALAVASHRRVSSLVSVAIAATYLMNWNRAFHWASQGLLPHTWTLSIEEQFYLLWPLAFVFIRRYRPLIWISVAIVCLFSGGYI
jgi:peptidoglycan/LPS O-acetylase OafA/YrhL